MRRRYLPNPTAEGCLTRTDADARLAREADLIVSHFNVILLRAGVVGYERERRDLEKICVGTCLATTTVAKKLKRPFLLELPIANVRNGHQARLLGELQNHEIMSIANISRPFGMRKRTDRFENLSIQEHRVAATAQRKGGYLDG